tara:strand:- start:624 stop:869 length:246 start_codon:yes stop_codon:yes gene_type:complete
MAAFAIKLDLSRCSYSRKCCSQNLFALMEFKDRFLEQLADFDSSYDVENRLEANSCCPGYFISWFEADACFGSFVMLKVGS